MVGLGVMGRNLLLNMADHDFAVAGYDRDPAKVEALRQEGQAGNVRAAAAVAEFVGLLRKPRAVMLLVPAGAAVDAVIGDLLPHLDAGDLIVDAGNSHFKDTDRRGAALTAKGLRFLGVGVSGGEAGARHGPSIMPGGAKDAYERVRPVLEAVAAKVNGEPCVAYLGPGSAGHFVKMVHNGIEYGIMQLIAETYDLMKRGLGLSDDELHEFFAGWNQGELSAYLLEITAAIFARQDDKTGQRLIDQILDVSRQNGTGMWTSQSAMELQVPTPTIDAAVAMRNLSALENQRQAVGGRWPRAAWAFDGDRNAFLAALPRALYAGGGRDLRAGPGPPRLGLGPIRLPARAGGRGPDLAGRLHHPGDLARRDSHRLPGAAPTCPISCSIPTSRRKPWPTRPICGGWSARPRELGLPAPGLMAALGYLDAYRSRGCRRT